MFSLVVISAMHTLGCSEYQPRPHKTSVTYGVSETDKDESDKDSTKESVTIKQEFLWD